MSGGHPCRTCQSLFFVMGLFSGLGAVAVTYLVIGIAEALAK